MRLIVGSDHAGRRLRQALTATLTAEGWSVVDLGCHGEVAVDYPEVAAPLARRVAGEADALGLLVCGTGVGMSMAANRVAGARAALCAHVLTAERARAHNDANVLCLGAEVVGPGLAESILRAFLAGTFAGGRHARRLQQISLLERPGASGTGG